MAQPSATGDLSVAPRILPFEGGQIQLEWHSTPAGAYVRDSRGTYSSSGPVITIDPHHQGGLETFELLHPLERWPLHSASVTIRPQWHPPAAVPMAESSRVLAAQVTPSGQLVVVGETEAAQAGAALGGHDLFVYRYSDNGQLLDQQQLGGPHDDRLIGLRASPTGVHLITRSTPASAYTKESPTFQHIRIDAQGQLNARPIDCLSRLNQLLDWQPLDDGTLLMMATDLDSPVRLHALHCGFESDNFQRNASTSTPLEGATVSALLLQGSTPEAAHLAITTNADLGAGSSPHPQPQLVRIDIPRQRWHARRLASTEHRRWLAGMVTADTLELVGTTLGSGPQATFSSTGISGQVWLMQAAPEGSFGLPTPLFEGMYKTPCCNAYQASRGPKPAAWMVGTVGTTDTPAGQLSLHAPELTAMSLPDHEPMGSIELLDPDYTHQLLGAIATDPSGDFYTISTGYKSDNSRWLRIEQFNEYGESRAKPLRDLPVDTFRPAEQGPESTAESHTTDSQPAPANPTDRAQ